MLRKNREAVHEKNEKTRAKKRKAGKEFYMLNHRKTFLKH